MVITCTHCGSRTAKNRWLDNHCRACWETTHPKLTKHAAAQRLSDFTQLLDEMEEDEAMGAGRIPSRPPGSTIRDTVRPGQQRWNGKRWVAVKQKPPLKPI